MKMFIFFLFAQQVAGPFYERWLTGRSDSLKLKPYAIFKMGNNLSAYDPARARNYFVGFWKDSVNATSQRNFPVNLQYTFDPTPTTNKLYKYTTPLSSLLRLQPALNETLKGAWGRDDPCLTGLYAGAYHWGKGYVQTMSSLYLHHYNYSGGTVNFYAGLSLDWHVVNGSRANKMVGFLIRRPEIGSGSQIDTLIGIELANPEGLTGLDYWYSIYDRGRSYFRQSHSDAHYLPKYTHQIGSFATNKDQTLYLVSATMGDVTVTLTNVAHQVVIIKILEIGPGKSVTLQPSSGTIEGYPSITITSPYSPFILWCDGNNWYILAER